MPKIRPGMARPPKGYDTISAGLDEYDSKMKEALAEPIDDKRKNELTHSVAKVNRARTRFVFEAFRANVIDKKVLEYCAANQFIDASLIKLWQTPGYSSACCVGCVDAKSSTHGGSCVCRVPAADRVAAPGPCARCGCNGCASGDGAHQKKGQQPQQKDPQQKKAEEFA